MGGMKTVALAQQSHHMILTNFFPDIPNKSKAVKQLKNEV